MCDLVSLSRTIPIAALEHRIHILPAVKAREALPQPHPGWVAIFLKAFAIVASRRPHLRQAYFTYPWRRIYEHPTNMAAITVEREWQDDHAIFFDMLAQPEKMGLMELQCHLHGLKTEPVENIHTFCRLIRGNILPWPLRWLVWRWLHSVSGPRRAYYTGTFAINASPSSPIWPVNTTGTIGTTLYFGLFNPDGAVDVCLTFDHRVMDGGNVIRALADLETVINTEIVQELLALQKTYSAPQPVAP